MKRQCPISYLPPAERDIQEILEFVQKEAPMRAVRFLQSVDRRIGRLGRFSLSGSVPSDRYLRRKGYRIVVIENYLVFYKVAKGAVVIYRVIHGKRRYAFLL